MKPHHLVETDSTQSERIIVSGRTETSCTAAESRAGAPAAVLLSPASKASRTADEGKMSLPCPKLPEGLFDELRPELFDLRIRVSAFGSKVELDLRLCP